MTDLDSIMIVAQHIDSQETYTQFFMDENEANAFVAFLMESGNDDSRRMEG